jgi:hypothetical protein
MADQVKPFLKRRRFCVLRAIRRYSRVAYECSGTYTVLEDPGKLLSKYPKDLEFSVTLLLEGAGTYERDDMKNECFASHELDALVKDKLLKELDVDLTVGDCIAAATDLAQNYQPSGIIAPEALEKF